MTEHDIQALIEEIREIQDSDSRYQAALAVASACERTTKSFDRIRFFGACRTVLEN